MYATELTPCLWKKTKHWKFNIELTEDFSVLISAPWANTWEHYDFRQAGITRATLHRGVFTIKKGYGSDGVTCGIQFTKAIPPAIPHDAICQFYRHPLAPFTRAQGDELYRAMNNQRRFPLRLVYNTLVFFGRFFPNPKHKDLEIIKTTMP